MIVYLFHNANQRIFLHIKLRTMRKGCPPRLSLCTWDCMEALQLRPRTWIVNMTWFWMNYVKNLRNFLFYVLYFSTNNTFLSEFELFLFDVNTLKCFLLPFLCLNIIIHSNNLFSGWCELCFNILSIRWRCLIIWHFLT